MYAGLRCHSKPMRSGRGVTRRERLRRFGWGEDRGRGKVWFAVDLVGRLMVSVGSRFAVGKVEYATADMHV